MFPRGEGARLRFRANRNSLVAYSIPEARATTDETRHEVVGERGANSLAVNAAGAFHPTTPRRRHGVGSGPYYVPALFSTIQRVSEAKLVIFYKNSLQV